MTAYLCCFEINSTKVLEIYATFLIPLLDAYQIGLKREPRFYTISPKTWYIKLDTLIIFH